MLLSLKIGCHLITPVFKKRNQSTAANYQLISLTSVLCKVMEHIIFQHIMSYFTSLNILNSLQYGFRPNHSCQNQLDDFIDEIQRSMNTWQQTAQSLMLISIASIQEQLETGIIYNKIKRLE